MNNQHTVTIDVVCRPADRNKFVTLGFVEAAGKVSGPAVRMVHRQSNIALVSTLVSLGGSGVRFWARTDALGEHAGVVMAGDGSLFIVVPAAGRTGNPIVQVDESGSLHGLEAAKDFWTVRTSLFGQLRSKTEVNP
ncbi:MAG: hypothetical protein Q7V53_07900 [Caldisericota bacterium]|nr:hypothetical protein [Caldisericota bacterium]